MQSARSALVRRCALRSLAQIIVVSSAVLYSCVIATLVIRRVGGSGVWIVVDIIVVVCILVVACIRVGSILVTSTCIVVGVLI